MGNPSAATTDVNRGTNYLMRKKQYVLSYNKSTLIPNWASWHLTQAWLGSAARADDFRPDPDLPKGWIQVRPSDYDKSGFDKGHMCNSKDRTSDGDSNRATFLMSNMIPQSPKNNEHTWEGLEAYCRDLVAKGRDLYITCGPFGKGGEGELKDHTLVKKDELVAKGTGGVSGAITVPAKTWKVVLVVPSGTSHPDHVTATDKTIAVIIPNNQEVDLDWTHYICSVDEVEALTGLHFFSEVAAPVAAKLKATKYAVEK